MFGFLLGLIDPISRIADKIAQYKIEQTKAQTDEAKIAANERVATLEARRDVMIAEAGSKLNAAVRMGFAFPFIVYVNKLIIWDKVLGWGSTDPLSDVLWNICWTVIGFYFLQWTASRTARIIKRS